MVETRRNGDKGEERQDLLSDLLDATRDESESDAPLNDEELVGGYSPLRSSRILGSRLTLPRKHIRLFPC